MQMNTQSIAGGRRVASPEGMSEAEWQIRCDLAACYQLTDLYGMSDLTANHISARLPGPDHQFLLNRFGMLFDEITASSLVKIDADGNVIGGDATQMNYAGFVIHSAIHMASPELTCVMHTHTNANNAVAMLREGLMPLTQKAMTIWHFLRYHDYEGPAVELGERERLVRDLGPDGRVMILRNHGGLTVGRSIPEAFTWMLRLEQACRQQVEGLSCARDLIPLSEDLIRKSVEVCVKGMPGSVGATQMGNRDWPALLRKLERERGTSYRT
jgi:ribulose-5-phosphate 4-epimerase/fuculose-1-phosphate aldolase